MEDSKPEEKSPLLLYLVDGDGSLSKNNKRVNFDKGRLYGISSGVTTIFSEFPGYISPCWITTLLSSLIFFMMVLMMMSTISSSNVYRLPCARSNAEEFDNKTIHLVHQFDNWSQKQLQLLELIRKEYEGFHIHLVLFGRPLSDESDGLNNFTHSTSTGNNSEDSATPSETNEAIIEIKRAKKNKRLMGNLKRKKRDHLDKFGPMGISFGVKSLLDILLRNRVETNGLTKRNTSNGGLNLSDIFSFTTQPPPPKTLKTVIDGMSNLTVHNATMETFFRNTPLKNNWPRLSDSLRIFAARSFNLWQYGGLSFSLDFQDSEVRGDVENFSVTPSHLVTERLVATAYWKGESQDSASSVFDKLTKFVETGKSAFEKLRRDVVTADDEGLHIFTKTPCHAFLGEILAKLRGARRSETPKDVLKRALKVFCRHSNAMSHSYCRNLIRQTN